MQGPVKSQSFDPHIRQVHSTTVKPSSNYMWWMTVTNMVGESPNTLPISLSPGKIEGNNDTDLIANVGYKTTS